MPSCACEDRGLSCGAGKEAATSGLGVERRLLAGGVISPDAYTPPFGTPAGGLDGVRELVGATLLGAFFSAWFSILERHLLKAEENCAA